MRMMGVAPSQYRSASIFMLTFLYVIMLFSLMKKSRISVFSGECIRAYFYV